MSLEIARGLAALWVFVYHSRLGIGPGLIRRLADAGFLGVPAFFVISGYCMMASSRGIIDRRQPATAFLKRRLLRIFPPFWASIAVAAALRWPHFSLTDWSALATLTKGLSHVGPAHQPYEAVNAVYWSLAIEVQFYLVMFAGLLLRRWFDTLLFAVTASFSAFSVFKGPEPLGWFPEYWPMFAIGLLLYQVIEKGIRPPRALLVMAGSVAAAVAVSVASPSAGIGRQTLFALLCGTILWAASGLEQSSGFVSRAMAGLGKMSYSIYLVHLPLIVVATSLIAPWRPRSGGFAVLLGMLATLPFTYVFYRFCEKPWMTSARPRVMNGWVRLPRSVAASAALLCILAIAALCQQPRSNAAAPVYGYRVVRVYPHDPSSFTQGLEYRGGFLYEGTGLNGRSVLRKVDLQTGKPLQETKLAPQFFGEGITVVNQRIVQLTWRSEMGFTYDQVSFRLLRNFEYQGEGWGLANDGKQIFMSDGTAEIRVWDPVTLRELRRFTVHDGSRPVTSLNELETVRDELYANVWQTDRIARISPADGRVVGWIDLTGLLSKEDRAQTQVDVLNGIAYDSLGDRLFVTGKLWPKLFEIQLVRRATPQ